MEIKENEIWGTLTSKALSKKLCILYLVLAIIFLYIYFCRVCGRRIVADGSNKGGRLWRFNG